MPSKKQYNLVNDDAYDSRIPLHSEEAFQHGINFHAKYIGTLDVPRPNSRVEIVAAMRRIRYEFKAKSIKKKKVTITISVEGVKVLIRKKKKKSQWPWDDSKFLVMHHPIYRIFYVSHDSQDLKIFSYIARDGGSNIFKCNVFKSSKKSQAMRIVRTVGQAFEVCHKLSLAHATHLDNPMGEDEEESMSDKSRSSLHDPHLPADAKGKLDDDAGTVRNHVNNNNNNPSPVKKSPPSKVEPLAPPINQSPSKNPADLGETYASPHSGAPLPVSGAVLPEGTPLSVHHQLQLLREQLEQQTQQSQATDAQLHLLKDQLAAETTARMDAQSQNSHLLSHNRELLEHIRVLVRHIQDLERRIPSLQHLDTSIDYHKPSLTENSSGTTTPSPGSLHLPNDLGADVSPTLSRSVSGNDSWLRKCPSLGRQGASPLASPRGAPTDDPFPLSPRGVPCDDPFPLSSPSSPSSLASNLEDLLKQSAMRIKAEPLPRLNPPPHKTKVARAALDLPPTSVSRSSSTSSSWTDSVLLTDSLSWPPGPLHRQFSLPSSQQQQPAPNDNFVSQALKDLTKLNLFDNNRELLRGIETHLNSDSTLNHS